MGTDSSNKYMQLVTRLKIQLSPYAVANSSQYNINTIKEKGCKTYKNKFLLNKMTKIKIYENSTEALQ